MKSVYCNSLQRFQRSSSFFIIELRLTVSYYRMAGLKQFRMADFLEKYEIRIIVTIDKNASNILTKFLLRRDE